jgi:outer membrane protein OmpA-like peptidoglycan-associated protein
MRVEYGLLTALLLLVGGTPVQAQKSGAVEIGAFGRFTKFESKLNFDNRVGVGGRLGVFVLPNLALEGDVTYTRTKSQGNLELRHTPVHARLIYNIPAAENAAVLVGAGYVRNIFRANYRETRSGVGGLLGVRFGLGDLLAARVDATGDYIPTAESDILPPQVAGVQHKKSNFHLGLQAGLSLLLRTSRDGDRDRDGVKDSMDSCPATPAGDAVDSRGCSLPKDADGDGVVDNRDRCPNTPAGTRVDAAGCPVSQDADGDGVADASDKCPNTPAGTAVDASGCPKDSDGDGVADASDKCPNTPAGTTVDATGCAGDADRDGVSDASDVCPDTPAGTKVDRFGCAFDSDGDGVTDDKDLCPATVAGTSVDAKGCTSLFQAGTPLILSGVNFETGKAILLPESQGILDQVAQSLVDNPDVNVEVGGHTDNTGRTATNVRLSEARANAVRDYLIEKGVDGGRITAKGYGQENPVADNATAAGRAANRRVELSRTN